MNTMRTFLLVLLTCLLPSAYAVPQIYTKSGGTGAQGYITFTVEWNPTLNRFDMSVTGVVEPSGYNVSVYFQVANTAGNLDFGQAFTTKSSAHNNTQFSIAAAPGQYLRFRVGVDQSSVTVSAAPHYYSVKASDGLQKTITLTHVNGSVARYYGVENTSSPGKAFQVRFVEAAATYTAIVIVPEGDTSQYQIVSIDFDGAFAAGGGEVTRYPSEDAWDFTGFTSPVGTPVNASAGTAGPAPPTAVLAPAGTPVTTSTATKKEAANPYSVAAGASTADGANAITSALNGLAAALEGAGGGGGGGGTDMSGVESRLDAINTNLQKIETKAQRDELIVDGGEAADTLGTTEGAAASGRISASVAASTAVGTGLESSGMLASAKGLALVLPIPADNGASSGANVVANTGGGIVGMMTLDTNPFTSPLVAALIGAGTLTQWAAWCRNAVVWLVTVGFVSFVVMEVKKNLFEIGKAEPLQLTGGTQIVLRSSVLGNSVGVPAALGMRVIIQAALATFFLALPVLIVADMSIRADAGSLMSAAVSAATNAGSASNSLVLSALSYTNRFLPLVLICTVAVNQVLVSIGGITQWVVYTIGMKLAPV